MSAGEQVDALLKRLGPKELVLLDAVLRKRLSRRVLLDVADEFESAAGLLRSIAGVRKDDDTEQRGPQD